MSLGSEPRAEWKLSVCCLARNVRSSSSAALVSGWRGRHRGGLAPKSLAGPGPVRRAAPHLALALPAPAALTWWDLALSQNEAADAQELRSHVDHLRGEKA